MVTYGHRVDYALALSPDHEVRLARRGDRHPYSDDEEKTRPNDRFLE